MRTLRTTVSLAVLLLLGACASAPPSSQGLKMEPLLRVGATPPSAEQAFEAGRRALDERRPATALAWFDLMLAAQPGSARALNGRAVALARLGRTAAAVQALEQALRAEPQAAHLHANLGRVLARGGEFGRALQALETAARLAPGDARLQADADALRQRLAVAPAPAAVPVAPLPTGSVTAVTPRPGPQGQRLATAAPVSATPTAAAAPRWVEVAPRQFELQPGAVTGTAVLARTGADAAPAALPAAVGLEISNGAGEPGLARRTAQRLALLGAPSRRITNHGHFQVRQTTVEFRPAQRAAAAAVARSLGLSVEMVATERLAAGVSVRVVLGRDARAAALADAGSAERPAVAAL